MRATTTGAGGRTPSPMLSAGAARSTPQRRCTASFLGCLRSAEVTISPAASNRQHRISLASRLSFLSNGFVVYLMYPLTSHPVSQWTSCSFSMQQGDFSAECVPDELTKYPRTTVVTYRNPGHCMAEYLPTSTHIQPQAYPRATGARPKCLRWWTSESGNAVVVGCRICCVAHLRDSIPRHVIYMQSLETGSGMHKPMADPHHSHSGLLLDSRMVTVSVDEEGRYFSGTIGAPPCGQVRAVSISGKAPPYDSPYTKQGMPT